MDVLKAELPFDYLTPSWHIEDGIDNLTWGFGEMGREIPSLYNLHALSRCSARAKRDVPTRLLRHRDASDFFVRTSAARSLGSLRNSRAVDGASQRQVGAPVGFLRRLPDGHQPKAPERLVGHSESLEISGGIHHYPPTPGVVDVMVEPLAAAPMAILWNVE